jgi:hypothetical protein
VLYEVSPIGADTDASTGVVVCQVLVLQNFVHRHKRSDASTDVVVADIVVADIVVTDIVVTDIVVADIVVTDIVVTDIVVTVLVVTDMATGSELRSRLPCACRAQGTSQEGRDREWPSYCSLGGQPKQLGGGSARVPRARYEHTHTRARTLTHPHPPTPTHPPTHTPLPPHPHTLLMRHTQGVSPRPPPGTKSGKPPPGVD